MRYAIRLGQDRWTFCVESQQSPDPSESRFAPVVVVPTFNNARTLRGVLDGIERVGLPVIVVNDGSTDTTDDVLAQWRESWADPRHRIVVHPSNRGKAQALRTGFRAAQEAGHTHALTIDSDGQLDPAEIPTLIDAARDNPASLVVGVRDVKAADYPKKSRAGRLFSNAAVKIECGLRVRDSQCGFRVYPLGLLGHIRCSSGRYAFETEVLTRAVWAGAGIVERPVSCRYEIEGGRVTHMRPWLDTLQGLVLHAKLLALSILPIPHAHPWHDENGRDRKGHDPRPWWRRLLHWINPLAAWREIKTGELRRDELAASLAFGVFIANLPLYGLHTLIGLYTAARLHLNPHLVIAGTTVATPPINFGLIAAAIFVGHLILHGSALSIAEINERSADLPLMFQQFAIEWSVGSLVVGFVLAVLTLFVSYAGFGLLQRKVADEDVLADL